jgi:hypothetical protein
MLVAFHLLNYARGWDAYDLEVFLKWTQPIHGVRRLYLDSLTNYPLLGTLVFALPLQVIVGPLGVRSFEEIARLYKWSHLPIDAVNVALLAAILRTLGVRRALLAALVLFLLPSFWADGALWGIGDNLSQLFLLLGLLSLARLLIAEDGRTQARDLLWFSLAAGSLCLGSMTKQLFYFSLPGLGVGLLLAARAVCKRHAGAGSRLVAVGLASGVVPLVLVDAWLLLPPGYHSHLAFVWLQRSSHIDDLGQSGLSLWSFISGRGSSLAPFAFGLSYKQAGLLAYGAAMGALSLFWLRPVLRPDESTRLEGRDLLVLLSLYLGLINLAFNVFLTGTHQRYPVHAYPFLLVALVGLWQLGKASAWELATVGALSAWFGAWMWCTMRQLHFTHAAFFVPFRYALVVAQASMFLYLAVRWARSMGSPRLSARFAQPTRAGA